MPETYGKLCAIHLGPYKARGKSFHKDQAADAIDAAIAQFATLCGEADQVMTKLAANGYPTLSAFKADASSVLQQLKAQCQALGQLFEAAKTSDQAKVSETSVMSQGAALAAAKQQQDADAQLLASFEGLVQQVQGDVDKAALPPQPDGGQPEPQPEPQPQPQPSPDSALLAKLAAVKLDPDKVRLIEGGADVEEDDRISGAADEEEL